MKIFSILFQCYDSYGFLGFLRLFFNLCYTKFFFKNCRLIRRPIYIRGKKKIDFGSRFTSGVGCRIEVFGDKASLNIGRDVEINDYVHIAVCEHVEIGDNCLIASKVFITDHNHGNSNLTDIETLPKERELSCNPVCIRPNVWVGQSVSILPGVTIGRNSIIGANSVVTKNIPDWSIALGNPAKVIKIFDMNKKKWIKQ